MTRLSDVKVLLVEDEGTVALLLEDMLEDLGCQVVDSIASIEKGWEACRSHDIDVAVLDVNVGGEPVFPLADLLTNRGIPVVFSTGYGASGLPAHLADRPVLSKPFTKMHLEQMLLRVLA